MTGSIEANVWAENGNTIDAEAALEINFNSKVESVEAYVDALTSTTRMDRVEQGLWHEVQPSEVVDPSQVYIFTPEGLQITLKLPPEA